MMTRKSLCFAAFGGLLAGASSAALADSAVINFIGNVESYSGSPALDPFNSNTALFDDGMGGTVVGQESSTYALINGLDGFVGLNSDDWERIAGQIVIPNFTGDGVYTATPDGSGGAGFYFVSPLLNRLEAVSLRTEGALTATSLGLGAGRNDGAPTQNRDDIYLPDFTPNGNLTVTVSGSDVSIDYLLDFSTLGDPNAAFLRDGTTPTQISQLLEAAGQQFDTVSISDSGTAVVSTATIGVDDDNVPYGGYNPFEAKVSGNLGNTIVPTLRGVLEAEVAAGNISDDGNGTNVLTATPFAGETGTVTFFDLTGSGDFDTAIALVPEPATAGLLAGLGLLASRRRRG